MGTKLSLFATVLFVIASSCISTNKSQDNDFFVKKEDFVKAYKTAFVCGCINEGTKGNFYKFLKDNNDLGLFTEGKVPHFPRCMFFAFSNEFDSIPKKNYKEMLKTK